MLESFITVKWEIERNSGRNGWRLGVKKITWTETLEAKKETPNELKPPLPQSQPVQSNQKNKNQIDHVKHKKIINTITSI